MHKKSGHLAWRVSIDVENVQLIPPSPQIIQTDLGCRIDYAHIMRKRMVHTMSERAVGTAQMIIKLEHIMQMRTEAVICYVPSMQKRLRVIISVIRAEIVFLATKFRLLSR